MMKERQFPQVGDRAGFVYGPCQDPRDKAGTITRVYQNRFSDYNADIQMDDGEMESITGAYTTVGIGTYLIRRKVDLEAMTLELRSTDPGFQEKVAAIAAVAGQPAAQVFALWREYQAKCGDQSAILFEFVKWYQRELGGDVLALISATE